VNLLKCVQTEFSRGFGDWLINQRVGLVCSTYRTGYLLFAGVRADGVPVPSAAGFSLAVGLAASSQRIYLGTKMKSGGSKISWHPTSWPTTCSTDFTRHATRK
jgi:hypothetical protein